MSASPDKVMALARRRGILWPSFEVHGKVAGFYDYGPAGTAIKRNVLEVWRRTFVVEGGLLEIDTPSVTPYDVFEASGHVEEFTDLMAKCGSCGSFQKVEGLLDGIHPNPGTLTEADVGPVLADVKCPDCGNIDWSSSEFNLMFSTAIGPEGGRKGFLRPETAQGIFVNFSILYRLARERMPFGVAQVGRGFRNEISPRQGPIRLREFNMAEIEFFVDPDEAAYPPLSEHLEVVFNLVPAGANPVEMTAGDAIKKGLVCSEYLMYFMARTATFLETVGIDRGRLRFRQHEENEMAHYAEDCWDAEIETSYGWIEVVGIADRSAYDLQAHIDHTGKELKAMRRLEEPVEMRVRKVVPVMKQLGRTFRSDAGIVAEALGTVDPDAATGKLVIEVDGRTFEVPPECYEVSDTVETVNVERFVPRVIEPSFGIDRIIYSALEHAYREEDRDGEPFTVLSLSPEVAPWKFGVFPLVSDDGIVAIATSIDAELRTAGVDTIYDAAGSIGRRYARMDEIGTPFCITVDHDSLDDSSVTIRSRDDRTQVRVPVEGLMQFCLNLIKGEGP